MAQFTHDPIKARLRQMSFSLENATAMQACVLIVDDDFHARVILGAQVRYMGHIVLEAPSAQEALELLFGNTSKSPAPVDLVISDVWMPGMSGIELLKAIHTVDPDIPVAMVSARATLDSSLEAINSGAYAYLTKPFRSSEVQKVVNRGLEKAQEARLRRQLSRYSSKLFALGDRLQEIRESPERISQEMLSELIAGLRHELGNMATAIKLNLDVIKERNSIPADLHENLDDLQASVDDLVSLLGRFKEYPEPGKIAQLMDLRQAVISAVDAAQGKDPAQGDRITLSVPEHAVNIYGAAPELSRAFLHLMENAIEAAGQTGGQVYVAVTEQKNMAMLTIEDEGPGFDEDLPEQAFSPSYTTKLKDGFMHGLGLGLFITRMVISLHGGEITLENRPEGGARVRVLIPLARADPTTTAA